MASTSRRTPRAVQTAAPTPRASSRATCSTTPALGKGTYPHPTDDAIDRSGGDQADATTQGGAGEDLEAGKPVSRVDQQQLASESDEVASH